MFLSLIGALSGTSLLLLAFAPPPLVPGASATLFAIPDSSQSMDAIFQVQPAPTKQRWQYIYIHHSRTPGGNAETLAQSNAGLGDHFLIGNGDGCRDGAVQVGHRWTQQQPALPPQGAESIYPTFVSICLVGDLDRAAPTEAQLVRLRQLVNSLQTELAIPANHVQFVEQRNAACGVGRYFPLPAFRQQLLN